MAKTLQMQMQPRRFEVIDTPSQVPSAPGRYDALRATLEQLEIGADGYSSLLAWPTSSMKEADLFRSSVQAGKDGWATRMRQTKGSYVQSHIHHFWDRWYLFVRWAPAKMSANTVSEQRRYELTDRPETEIAPKLGKYDLDRQKVEDAPMDKTLRMSVADKHEANLLIVALATSGHNDWAQRMRERGIRIACRTNDDDPGQLWVEVTKKQITN